MTTSQPSVPDEPQRATSWLAAIAVWIGSMAVAFEMLGTTVILPPVAAHFGISAAESAYVVKAFHAGVLLVLLPLSSLGERVGYDRLLRAGFLVLALGAAGAMVAPTYPLLIACRFAQGLGASAIVSVGSALIRHIFPARYLVRAFSYSALIVACTAAAGPAIVSGLLAFGSWHRVFILTAALCVIALVVGWRSLPHSSHDEAYDWLSAILYIVAAAALLGGIELVEADLSVALVAIAAIVFVPACAALFHRSLRHQRPIVPFDLLRSSSFILSVLTSIGAFSAQTLAFIALPFFLIGDGLRTAEDIGPLLVAWPAAIAVSAPLAGRLAERLSPSVIASVGLTLMGTGLALLSVVRPDAGALSLMAHLALCGVGFGLFQTPNNYLLLTAAPMQRAGAAAGMQAMARHLGQIVGAIAAGVTFRLFSQSYGPVFLCGSIIALIAGVAGVARWHSIRSEGARSARA